MLQNNCDLPKHIYGYVRNNFLNNLDNETDTSVQPCVIYAVESHPGRAIGFHILRNDGACIAMVPIHALCHKPDADQKELWELEAWDCFGWNISAIEFNYLRELDFICRLPQPDTDQYLFEKGSYVCSLDFFDNGWSDDPGQHKHLHLIALQNGNFALQPNNRVQILEKSFVHRPFSSKPKIQTNKLKWTAE
jgi:hypothetical protein